MSITNSGKVGIGTITPSSTLEVNGPTTLDCTLDVKGNVGIGTAAPSSTLDVNGTISATKIGVSLPGAPGACLEVNSTIRSGCIQSGFNVVVDTACRCNGNPCAFCDFNFGEGVFGSASG